MKQLLTFLMLLAFYASTAQTHYKQDGTPDMRYKENKQMYGGYNNTNYPTQQPVYYQPVQQERNYDNGGQLRLQNGYYRNDGTYVEPHLKTTPDNNQWNNLSN
jgi:hypothetical protein